MMSKTKSCVLIATKDRNVRLNNLLESISKSNVKPDLIAIVSSGTSIDFIVNRFKNTLNISHLHTTKSGQVFQRNKALEIVDDNYDLFIFLDDDVIVDSNFFAELDIYFRQGIENIGGIGINLVTSSNQGTQNIIWRKIQKTKFVKSYAGKVLKSGRNMCYLREDKTIPVKWLNGLSIWTRKVISEYTHVEMGNYYAAAEDLIFSYNVGKKYKLMYNPSIKVYDQNASDLEYVNPEIIIINLQHKLYFVLNNRELKLMNYYIDLIYEIVIRTINLSKGNYKEKIAVVHSQIKFLIKSIINIKKYKRDLHFRQKLINEIL